MVSCWYLLNLCDGKDALVRTINFDMNKEVHPIFCDIFLMQEQHSPFLLPRSQYVALKHS